MKTWILAAWCLLLAAPARADYLEGTIVSIRAGIYQVRPTLRPRLTRVSVSEKTSVVGARRIEATALKPGMRVRMFGPKAPEGSFAPLFLEAAEGRIGALAPPLKALVSEGDWQVAAGTIETLDPLVVRDDEGKTLTTHLKSLRGARLLQAEDRRSLLIGMRVEFEGERAPDGVLIASSATPARNQAAVGTMFGQIVSQRGNRLTILPRYATETIDVVRVPGSPVLREIRVEPSAIRVGDAVTFWGKEMPDGFFAYALILGPGRYPVATEGDDAGVYLPGRLTALRPTVRFRPAGGAEKRVIVPGQMILARLEPIPLIAVRPGASVMLVLSRGEGDTFQASCIVLDASPWVGYGG